MSASTVARVPSVDVPSTAGWAVGSSLGVSAFELRDTRLGGIKLGLLCKWPGLDLTRQAWQIGLGLARSLCLRIDSAAHF